MRKHKQYYLIPDKAIVNTIYTDGTIGQNGKVVGKDLHNMLRDFTYDKEFDLWYSDKGHDFAYEVTSI